MAEGRSNAAIAERLVITERAVAKHTASMFLRLGLQQSEDDNRRVLAVLAYLGTRKTIDRVVYARSRCDPAHLRGNYPKVEGKWRVSGDSELRGADTE